MTLSTSRQQFLAYETQGTEDNIQYGRKGGIFISTFICVSFIIFAVVLAALFGIIVYFITYFKLSHKSGDFWDETEPFGQAVLQSPDLRLPTYVVPSFYRLKLKTDLDNSTFSGEVYITIRANKKVKEIILHSKDLVIKGDAKLTEQIYEKVDMLVRKKRQNDVINLNNTIESKLSISNNSIETTKLQATSQESNFTKLNSSLENVTEPSLTINKELNATTESPVTHTMKIPKPTTDFIPVSPINTHVSHGSVRNIKIVSIKQSSGDRLVLALASPLSVNVDYTLELSFEGNISNSLTGFYKSSYLNSKKEVKKLGVTQFEPTSARAAFPCFDEPAFKAKFEISIAHPQNLTVLSNMKVASTETIPEKASWQWTHFERSVNMSTYLVAYILSDFKSVTTSYVSKDNMTKTINIWARPESISKAKYAAEITPKLLSYYEDVFGVPYALDKLDLIAIPDFSSGAMENWGLMTFRETTLLFDEQESVPRDKQNVAIDIAHELAHQWFGNLVTMQWWTDLWLNEGFATYIEYVGVDHIEPSWTMLDTFSRDKMDLLLSDALKNTSPVSRKVVDASEISQKFDEISYSKGANLIRMLNHTVSEEVFHKGLMIYLQQWKYTNAQENDLWEAMSRATQEANSKDISIVEFMNSWTRQAGYPVLSVHRDYGSGDVMFEQSLFSSSKDPYPHMTKQLWQIPISYVTTDAPPSAWDTKPKLWLKSKTMKKHLAVNSSQALYVNVDAIGYYRVNYDQENWELLSRALQAGRVASPVARAQLIDDAFNLAKTSRLNYSYALRLSACVRDGEDSKIVWDLLLNNMMFLRFNLRATSGYVYFQDYMKILLAKQLETLNYGLDKPRNDNEAFLIENLLTWECYVEAPRCLAWARQQFDSWMLQDDVDNNPIPSYLRSVVYSMALRHGGRREFQFLWSVFQRSGDPGVRSLVMASLPSTREEGLITTLLERSLSDIPKQYAVFAWGVAPPEGARVAQQFLIDNFDEVYEKFTNMDSFMFPSVLNGAFGFISSEDELDKLKSFALKHKEKLLPMSQTLQKLVDTATVRIRWARLHAAGINKWFKDYLEGHANITSHAKSSASPTVVAPGIFIPNTNSTVKPDIVATTESTVNVTERVMESNVNVTEKHSQ